MTNNLTSQFDLDFMAQALDQARLGLGQAWPNPAVGCVIVREGQVVGRGFTQRGGRPHAETMALEAAGAAALGASAYVTLEPCSHHGQTPPCADALINAGIARVVSSLEDPDPRVAGSGHARLREAGLAVDIGLMADDAARLNAGFISRIKRNRPRVVLKLATSLDGRIATARGESKWITSEASRQRAQWGRAETDAIMVGSSTALIDDPDLTCRIEGQEHRSPVRVVADGRLRLPLNARLVKTARQIPSWVVTFADADMARRHALAHAGVEILGVPALLDKNAADRALSPMAILGALSDRGITRLMIEGGAKLASAFLAAGAVDAIAWYRAPIILGGDGVPAVAPLGISHLADALKFTRRSVEPLGQDLLELYDILA
jgi:diaminohydroxyphosphoribosylaminopyrimidine deaminase/5-amino-6-(5-phosphoribosylamino)uracil reductase